MNHERYEFAAAALTGSGLNAAHVRPTQRRHDNLKHRADQRGKQQRLREHLLRLLALFPPRGMRDERGCADRKHLRNREDDEGQVAGDAYAGDGFSSEAADPVEVDEEVQGLENHRHQHEAGGLQKMACDAAGGEVLHRQILSERRVSPVRGVVFLNDTSSRCRPKISCSRRTRRCREGAAA